MFISMRYGAGATLSLAAHAGFPPTDLFLIQPFGLRFPRWRLGTVGRATEGSREEARMKGLAATNLCAAARTRHVRPGRQRHSCSSCSNFALHLAPALAL